MRIIAGKFRGRRLKTINSNLVRPTTDRARQAIFDTLSARMDFEGALALDCFAGSGLLGFEALSRGAQKVTFVEQNPQVARHIAQSIQLLNVESQAELRLMDAMRFVAETNERYHLIFADPPYDFRLYDKFLRKIFERHLLLPDGYLILEHHEREKFDGRERFAFQKNFGSTVVSFFALDEVPESQSI
ncbi:MAG: 16S rRNA (guanine(966)-N(2))-methyltransferase RsmD [Chloroherpetonaceae bacterium]|nr:16S rRNA (guanine(966)-N(2))-methyltransferase RsmD [Chloroherpetonaceae bacterium]MDW8438693.1 16S rRNA (guanine(966)-N(2))-methyltransferase RsmD [Chloroherpetonaceae bacterium]